MPTMAKTTPAAIDTDPSPNTDRIPAPWVVKWKEPKFFDRVAPWWT